MYVNWKALGIIILVGLGTVIFIPTALGYLSSSKAVIGTSVVLGSFAYLGFVNWYIKQ